MKADDGVRKIVAAALREDIGTGDITTRLLLPKPPVVAAAIIAGDNGILCGLPVVEMVFSLLDKNIRITRKVKEGAAVRKGALVCMMKGASSEILTGERVALNFLGRLSGIATLTRRYVEAVRGHPVKILDTRKTTPGLRALEKYAVRVGGGRNHRMGLWDRVLVKENHLAVLGSQLSVVSLGEIISCIRKKTKRKVEIETQNIRQFREALEAKPDIIMLDNMGIADIKKAVQLRGRLRVLLEVSGGVTVRSIRAIAQTGVDMISAGTLTHSVTALDFSLDII